MRAVRSRAAPSVAALSYVGCLLHILRLTIGAYNHSGEQMPDAWVITLWWALPSLVAPLSAIPVAMGIQWLFSRPSSFASIIADGQFCFYSVTILAAAWYDIRELHMGGQFVDIWIILIGTLATLGYGILATDHLGEKQVTKGRAATMSVVIGLASIALAFHVHTMVVVAH
jgi:hypothetical protein